VFICKNGEMHLLETVPRFTSIGCFYNAVTQAVAFRPVGEDWKLMGLAAMGDPHRCYSEIASLSPRFENGQWTVTRYTVEAKLIDRPKFLKQTELWKMLSRLVDRYGDCDVAAAAQKVFEDNLATFFEYLLRKSKTRNVVLAGGVFHNIKFCMRLKENFPEININVHPAAGDVGTAVGAALELYHQLTGEPACHTLETMALGPEYSDTEMLGELMKYAESVEWERPSDIVRIVGFELAKKKVIGLFHGRSEWGPRALGQRSVIADPSDKEMCDRINSTLKNREWFMPFAPSILEEDGPRYLKDYHYSPFMTNAFSVTEQGKKDLSSAIHLDYTARPQIVNKDTLPHYHAIISAFKDITGIGAVLNTSFNRHGLPIVNCPKDAVNHLIWGCVDVLNLGPFLVRRKSEAKPYKKRFSMTVDEMIKKWEPFDRRLLQIRKNRAKGAAAKAV
ncbi:MAG: carbamoyltransferase C-terminal domain-containing protein, partial [Thermodesulfobacteriota bacterium]|nr:carbamoyltransferase C-terminal domain-containing protein [Thermodesulfobacteriota bacterium]